MELLLLKLVAFSRQVASVEYAESVFDLASIVLFGAAILVLLSTGAVRKTLRISASDIVVACFVAWCIATYIIYFETSQLRHVAKLLIPLVSFIVVKNVITTREQYKDFVFWMIVGFSVPTVLSAILIAAGMGLDYVNYWTGVPRWRGAYANSHNMGHSMTLLLIVLVAFYHFSRSTGPSTNGGPAGWRLAAIGPLALLALYCLYQSQVRSAILGLVVFAAFYLALSSWRRLVVLGVALAVVAVALFPYWAPALLPDFVTLERGGGSIEDLGSGRPKYWAHNLKLFAGLPIDQQLAGVGIGNIASNMDVASAEVLDSHNDWLDLLMQTGIVGLALFLALQVILFRAILKLSGRDRVIFLSLFVAATVMMFVSNSYAWRIQVGHLYYMLLAFVEIPGAHLPQERVLAAGADRPEQLWPVGRSVNP